MAKKTESKESKKPTPEFMALVKTIIQENIVSIKKLAKH